MVYFTDVNPGDWYYQAVEQVVQAGLMCGVSATAFSPKTELTCGMLVAISYRMEGSPAVAEAACFANVDAGMYYGVPTAWAAANGVVNGYSAGAFGPNSLGPNSQ